MGSAYRRNGGRDGLDAHARGFERRRQRVSRWGMGVQSAEPRHAEIKHSGVVERLRKSDRKNASRRRFRANLMAVKTARRLGLSRVKRKTPKQRGKRPDGRCRVRTSDLLLVRQALSQLKIG